MERYILSHLERLEAESIHIFREVAAEFENPVMLYSIGKDSSVMLRLAQKAFYPGKLPFKMLHIDTGFKFPEMIKFRDDLISKIGERLDVYRNEEYIAKNTNPDDLGCEQCCQHLKTEALLDALQQGEYDAAIGGARREEEKARAKERVFSVRDPFGAWDPKRQRPELWNLYNCRLNQGETIRVFPLSNWTEIDIWHYVHVEKIPVVPLYFAQKRKVIERSGVLLRVDEFVKPRPGEKVEEKWCRYRSLGCSPCTGAILSTATSITEILEEVIQIRRSERENRLIDHDSDSSMEQKKKDGYF